MNITILAKSGISILALVVLFVLINGIAQNNQAVIEIGKDMFWGVLGGIIVITTIINFPKILKAFL